MSAHVIPIAEGGAGRYTFERSKAFRSTFRIRRGADVVGTVAVDDSIPFAAELLERVCKAFADHEREVRW